MNIHLPFTNDEFDRGRLLVKKAIEQRGLDCLLVSSPENMFYLSGYDTTGFHSYPHLLVIPLDEKPTLVTRQYEVENAGNSYELGAVGYDDGQGPVPAVASVLSRLGISWRRVGVEKNVPWLRVAVYEGLQKTLPAVEWSDGSGLVEAVRSVKSEQEIRLLRLAGAAASAGTRGAIAASVPGNKDAQVAAASYQARLEAGSHHVRTPTYVSTGKRSALVTKRRTDRLFRRMTSYSWSWVPMFIIIPRRAFTLSSWVRPILW